MAELELYKCKTCGEPLDIRNIKDGVLECKYCGNVYTVPKEETNPAALSFLRMGEHDLDVCKFDEAFEAYKKAAELDKNEPEAFWGMALSKFKVQYLKDEVNNRLQPICHEVTENKFTDDSDYMRAFTKATPNQREEYEKRAKDIDYIQSEFCKLEKTGLDYDCFICVKVTGENGEPTEDSKDADYIYRLLNDKGYKPFYSEYEIRNKQGADYEAHILYALYKSECMLVVCRNEDFLNTKWVKNEYTRFLRLVNDEEKESDSITFVYYKKAIEKLPGKKGKIQGIDFSRRSADGQITEFVERHTPEAKRKREEVLAAKVREEEEQKKRFSEQQRLIEERQKAFDEQQRQIAEQLEKLKSSSAPVSGGLTDEEILLRMERARAERERKKREEEERITREKAEAERKAREESARIAREESERRAKEEAERNWIKENEPVITCYNSDEFEIKGTVLKKYKCNKNNVKVPKGVTYISENAFSWCSNLKSINISDKVTFIGNSAFYGCTDLTSINIPVSVTFIGNSAFYNCKNLTSITIPDSVTSIGFGVFKCCTSLTRITIPDNVTSIGEEAFYNCKNLTSITIPNSVTSIGRNAFRGCTSLESITLPFVGNGSDKTYLGFIFGADTDYNNSEYVPSSLKTVVISGGDSIGENAFAHCTNLESITIPDSITTIGGSAFTGCTSLTSITIPDSVTSIGSNAFSGCACEIKWGDNTCITQIGYSAFAEFKGNSIPIPKSVISIGNGAFRGCTNLTKITIPDNVTSIGKEVFRDCDNLTIFCKALKKPAGWDKDWNVIAGFNIFTKKRVKVVWGYKEK